MKYIIELYEGCWVADWEGYYGRTLVIANAKQFETKQVAEKHLARSRKQRPFVNAKIIEVQK